MEEKLKDDEHFDYEGLVKGDKARQEKLKFWTNELCKKKPHMFDIILAV